MKKRQCPRINADKRGCFGEGFFISSVIVEAAPTHIYGMAIRVYPRLSADEEVFP
jgi:hypothetical protein